MARKRPDHKPVSAGPRANGTAPMAYTGLKYGENQAVNDMLPARNTGAQPAVGGAPQGRPRMDLTQPTARPNEPLTAGIDMGAGPGSPPQPAIQANPNMLLAELARKYPHPDLLRLLARQGG